MRLLRSTPPDEPLRREPALRDAVLRVRLTLDDADDFALLRDDPEEPPGRLFDPEALPRPELPDPWAERERSEPDLCRDCCPCGCCSCC